MNLLKLEQLADGRRYRLIEPFYLIDYGRRIIVPSGFITDFASVPRLFWRIFPPSGTYSRAAIVHDYLYQTGRTLKAEADEIFLELMERLDVGAFTRNCLYWAVKLFGGPVWRNYRRKERVC